MDINKLIERVKAILLTPKTTWPVIAEEPATTADIYKGYVMILAAVPAIFSFLGTLLIGSAFGMVRFGFGVALGMAVVGYILAIVAVFVISFIVDMLAPNFGGQKNSVQALKAVAYAMTASWVAGIGAIIPVLGWLIAIAGGVYSIYLLYLGLPPTMKTTQEKAPGYTAVVVIVAIVVLFVINLVIGGIVGVGMMGRGAFSSSTSAPSSSSFDPDSKMGKLEKWGQQMEAASKQMESAQKSGDQKAQGDAMGAMMSAALGGGSARAEALPPDRMKALLPDTLGGLPRKTISAERNGMLGMQVSVGQAEYGGADGGGLSAEITDTGGAKGLIALAGWASIEGDKETESGYEKTYRQDGRLIHEEWDRNAQTGKFAIVLADRFIAEVRGHADSMDQLKTALASLNLGAIESLKNEGVKN